MMKVLRWKIYLAVAGQCGVPLQSISSRASVGLSLGFEQAGFDVVASVEYDPVHAAVHKFNFPLTSVICADVSKLDSRAIWKRQGKDFWRTETTRPSGPERLMLSSADLLARVLARWESAIFPTSGTPWFTGLPTSLGRFNRAISLWKTCQGWPPVGTPAYSLGSYGDLMTTAMRSQY